MLNVFPFSVFVDFVSCCFSYELFCSLDYIFTNSLFLVSHNFLFCSDYVVFPYFLFCHPHILFPLCLFVFVYLSLCFLLLVKCHCMCVWSSILMQLTVKNHTDARHLKKSKYWLLLHSLYSGSGKMGSSCGPQKGAHLKWIWRHYGLRWIHVCWDGVLGAVVCWAGRARCFSNPSYKLKWNEMMYNINEMYVQHLKNRNFCLERDSNRGPSVATISWEMACHLRPLGHLGWYISYH